MALNELDTFAAAIRRSESGAFGGNYGITKQTPTGLTLGAYQISETNWADWALRAGLVGADWRNRGAQDSVAKARMTELYNIHGDWRLVALSWFFGGETARRVAQTGLEGSGFEREIEQLESNMRTAHRASGKEGSLSIEEPLEVSAGEGDFTFGPLGDAAPVRAEPGAEPEPGEVRQTVLQQAQARQQGDVSVKDENRAAHNVNSQMANNVGAILQGLSNAIKRGALAAGALPEGTEEEAPLPTGAEGSPDEVVPGGAA